MMDFFELAVVLAAIFAAVYCVRNLSGVRHKKAKDGRLDELIGTDDMIIARLKSELKSLRGKLDMAQAPPYGAEASSDVIEKAIPKWARPFAKPLMEWAGTDEGRTTIDGLIKKYAKLPAGGEPQTDSGGV